MESDKIEISIIEDDKKSNECGPTGSFDGTRVEGISGVTGGKTEYEKFLNKIQKRK